METALEQAVSRGRELPETHRALGFFHFAQLDFDQACAVLDQLQERGLIGPYMGGRTRDILLTPEEWLVQAPVA